MVFTGSLRDFGIKDAAIAAGGSILFITINFLLDPELALIFSSNPFGTRFPGIIVLALVAIFYGPVVGVLAATVGTFGYSIILRMFIQGIFIPRSDMLMVIGTMIAGLIAGGFSKPFRAKNLAEENLIGMESWKDLFSMRYLRNLLRNTISAVLGFSFVFSLWITYGNRLFDLRYSAFTSFIKISYTNGIYIMISVPLLYILITVSDFLNEKQMLEMMRKEMKPKITVKGGKMVEISSIEIPEGETIWQEGWGAINLKVKNVSTEPKKFEVMVTSNDIFSPDSHDTPILKPNEEDSMYFNVYGLSSGKKHATVTITEKNTENNEEGRIEYFVNSSSSVIVQQFSALFLVLGLAVAVIAIFNQVLETAQLNKTITLALVAIPIESILILILNWVRSKRQKKSVLHHTSLGVVSDDFDENEEFIHDTTEYVNKLLNKVKYNSRISRIFLLISAILFFLAWFIIILSNPNVLNRTSYNFGDLIFYIIIALIITSTISQVYLERAEQAKRKIKENEEFEKKIIVSLYATGPLIKYKETKMIGLIINPLETQGLRIYIHTLDHVVPRMILLDIPPNSESNFEFTFVPLESGTRKISFEIVPLRDKEGNIIPGEKTETYDQETVTVKSASQLAFGLTPTQIEIIKRFVTGASIVAVVIAFLARIFGIVLSPATLQATIPLVIVLQSPVIYLYLYLTNKREKALTLEE